MYCRICRTIQRPRVLAVDRRRGNLNLTPFSNRWLTPNRGLTTGLWNRMRIGAREHKPSSSFVRPARSGYCASVAPLRYDPSKGLFSRWLRLASRGSESLRLREKTMQPTRLPGQIVLILVLVTFLFSQPTLSKTQNPDPAGQQQERAQANQFRVR